MANKPKPTVLKVIQGNPGKRKLPENEPEMPVADGAECPCHFVSGGAAASEWERLYPMLVESRVLTCADLTALEMYCSLYQQYREAIESLETDGLVIQGEKGVSRNPASVAAIAISQQMRMYMVELGLTPSSRTRVKAAPAKKTDPLDKYLGKKK